MSSFSVETGIFDSQIPGGMISNMESQLKAQGAGGRLREVLEEVPRVRKDAGYPPLVTPSSQIVGSQAVFNVIMGRYKVMTAEFADPDARGRATAYTMGEKDPEKLSLWPRPRPAARSSPSVRLTSSLPNGLPCERRWRPSTGSDGSDEDVLTYAMSSKVAPGFFTTRAEGPKNVGKDPCRDGGRACRLLPPPRPAR